MSVETIHSRSAVGEVVWVLDLAAQELRLGMDDKYLGENQMKIRAHYCFGVLQNNYQVLFVVLNLSMPAQYRIQSILMRHVD